MKHTKIPKSFIVGGQKIDIKHIERCDSNGYGECCIAAGYIEIADKFNKDLKQTDTSKTNTFYHELIHCILDTMGRKDLSGDEVFVCSFAGFLTEAMANACFVEK